MTCLFVPTPSSAAPASVGGPRPCRAPDREAGDGRWARTRAAVILLVLAVGCASTTSTDATSTPSTMPPVRLVNLSDGAPADLAAYRGKPVIVNLWASWCTPCRAEMPMLQATQDRLGDKAQIVGITDDPNRDAARQAAATTKVNYPLLVDTDENLQSALGVTGLPATLFLDKEGRIVERHAGILDAAALNETMGRLYGIT